MQIIDYDQEIITVSKRLMQDTEQIINGQLLHGRNLKNLDIGLLIRTVRFIRHVAKTEQLPVIWDQKLMRLTYHLTPLGRDAYFYLTQLPDVLNNIPNKWQPAPEITILQDVMHDLGALSGKWPNLDAPTLATVGPSMKLEPCKQLNESGLRQGDLINNIVQHLRKALKTTLNRSKMRTRKNEVRASVKKKIKLIEGLEQNRTLNGYVFELMYANDLTCIITLEKSHQHLTRFLECLQSIPGFCRSLGYFWDRVYRWDAGYKVRLCLLFDAHEAQLLASDLESFHQAWTNASENAGISCQSTIPFFNVTGLSQEIESVEQRDLYLRPQSTSLYPHFGVSDLPSTSTKPKMAV